MNILQQQLQYYRSHLANKTALCNEHHTLTYAQLYTLIEDVQTAINVDTVGLLLNNSIAWAIWDLVLLFNKKCAVPLPAFFSSSQLKHSISDAKIALIITDTPQRINDLSLPVLKQTIMSLLETSMTFIYLDLTAADNTTSSLPSSICKITYTSGTTGTPKGVMLNETCLMAKVQALSNASAATQDDSTLSLLPLTTLLENIGGLYVPLYNGAKAYLLSPDTLGMQGSSKVNAEQLLATISNIQPTAFIIIPQLLLLLVQAVQNGYRLPSRVRFIAVGGAPVSLQLLQLAQQLALPVYQGYGLSEAASVVALNNPEQNRLGSVGKIISLHNVKIAQDGEILIKGSLFSGYLGHLVAPDQQGYYATGDLGKCDEDGYLYVEGRKKNIIHTSYGRNISPEWLEKELDALPSVAQSVVYGHAQAYIIALIVLRHPDLEALFQQQLQQLNSQLPDYAQIQKYHLLTVPFSIENKQLTGTHRPIRETIYRVYENTIQQLYEQSL